MSNDKFATLLTLIATMPRSEAPNPKHNIIIKGARLHNLKNIDLVLPHKKLIVITGLSGSGKSTLAFDTLYGRNNFLRR